MGTEAFTSYTREKSEASRTRLNEQIRQTAESIFKVPIIATYEKTK